LMAGDANRVCSPLKRANVRGGDPLLIPSPYYRSRKPFRGRISSIHVGPSSTHGDESIDRRVLTHSLNPIHIIAPLEILIAGFLLYQCVLSS
jgi:hypothetical protein